MSSNRKVELYRDDAGEYRWRRWASSDIVAESGEGYDNRAVALARAREEAEAFDAMLIDLTQMGDEG